MTHALELDPVAARDAIRFALENDEKEERSWRLALERAAESGNTVSRERAPVSTGGCAIDLARVAAHDWYADQGYFCGPEIAAEISDEDRKFALGAEGEYLALCRETTGDFCEDDAKAEKQSRQAHLLLELTKRIAEKMRAAGFDCMRESPFALVRYFMHSRQVEEIPAYRRTCFLPYVAQGIRAPMVAALEFWLSKTPFARFWTFSSGKRVRLAEVRRRAAWLHGKLNDLNAQDFMRSEGVRIVFRSTELGTPETDMPTTGGDLERDETGAVCFHVHAHCVIEMTKGFIPPARWSKLVAKVGDFWPAWWGEGGAIRSARECCKYVTKPGEMLKLSGAELVALKDQLFRLKLVQPMGSLAAEIRAREKGRLRLVRKESPNKGGRIYYAVKNWNSHARRTRDEANQDAAQKLTAAAARRSSPRIVSRGVPRCGLAGVAEPVAVVMFMRGCWNEDSIRSHPLIAPVIAATAEAFSDGVAMRVARAALRSSSESSGIRVHTRTPTVCPEKKTQRGKPQRARLSAACQGY